MCVCVHTPYDRLAIDVCFNLSTLSINHNSHITCFTFVFMATFFLFLFPQVWHVTARLYADRMACNYTTMLSFFSPEFRLINKVYLFVCMCVYVYIHFIISFLFFSFHPFCWSRRRRRRRQQHTLNLWCGTTNFIFIPMKQAVKSQCNDRFYWRKVILSNWIVVFSQYIPSRNWNRM